jgi:cyclopropane-fatty-acyl-phospholipid synthase
VTRARHNVHRHYDLGNDFYRLWLDREMVYTCAYFADPGMTLEEAQAAKHEHIARKLNLRPGETVFEAGCGWGSLALYLARRCGVRVKAWNVSHEQITWARARAAQEGLAEQVEFIEDDYRRIAGSCDAFLSVGMLEHVGRRQHAVLGEVIDRCLDPTRGRGLLHFIGRNTPAATGAWISKYIFPGAYIPSLREALGGVLEPRGFSVLDVENLRLHYAATLAAWLARFEDAADLVRAMFDERFVRMWRLYLAEAKAGFRMGSLQLFQVTFARPLNDNVPMTRAVLYRK